MGMTYRDATTPEAYLAAHEEPGRSDIATIHERVRVFRAAADADGRDLAWEKPPEA